jgi:hypothetical protein
MAQARRKISVSSVAETPWAAPWSSRSDRFTLLVLVALLLVVAPAGAARAQAPPQLESFTINAPLVNFLHTVVGSETFTVTLRLDRPAPAGGTRVRVSKLRDSGPIYTLPKEAMIPQGRRSRTFTVETLPIAPGDITPSNQQLAGSIVSVEHPNVLFGSVFVVPHPRDDPRGDPVTYEAENATLAGVRVVSDAGPWSLASNEAFVVYTSPTGSATFDVQARGGTSLVVFRYAYRLRAETDAGHDQWAPAAWSASRRPRRELVPALGHPGAAPVRANTIRVAAVRRSEPVNLDFIQVAVP